MVDLRKDDPRNIVNSPGAQAALTYFQRQGWSPEAASGITANLFGENAGFDPAKGQVGGGPGYGLAQWGPGRQQAFQAWANKPIQGSSFYDQLGFVDHELTDGAYKQVGEKVRTAENPANAALTVLQRYEIAQDRKSDGPNAMFRQCAAQALYHANFPSGGDEDAPPQQVQVTAQPIAPPSIMPAMFPMPRLST